jgi:hypothetical protein
MQEICHDLEVHEIELEMQNEELVHTYQELDNSNKRYFDFYNLAPVGYLTLSEEGLILEANLTSSTLLGISTQILIQKAGFTFYPSRGSGYLLSLQQKFFRSNKTAFL